MSDFFSFMCKKNLLRVDVKMQQLFLALTHQQVLDQLSHKCCSLW